MEDSMNNYRINMPHYDSMPHHYIPRGIYDLKSANAMPDMPEDMFQRPFIPEAEMPLDIDGDIPALPSMPGMPQQVIPGLIPPWMPQNGMFIMPGMPQTQMPMMPEIPGMPQTQMPMMPEMPPVDGNIYPVMPENGVPPVTCEQLRELLRWMNCPLNAGNNENTSLPPADENI